jgi:hypothetical protein
MCRTCSIGIGGRGGQKMETIYCRGRVSSFRTVRDLLRDSNEQDIHGEAQNTNAGTPVFDRLTSDRWTEDGIFFRRKCVRCPARD